MPSKCLLVLFIAALLLIDFASSSSKKHGDGRTVACYYTNWSQYRPAGGTFWPEDIDVSLCTHLIYAFAKIQNGVLAPYEWNDESTQWSKGLYARFNDLKTKKPGLKTLLSVGGWNLQSGPFSDVVATPAAMKTFIDDAVLYLRKRNFDGLDVDWEFPTQRGGRPADRDNFSQFIKTLRNAFDNETTSKNDRLLLTVAVAGSKSIIDAAYDIPAIVPYVDFINLMAYDFHGTWEPYTGITSPLYAMSSEKGDNATLNQDWAVRYWLSKGAPKNKLLMGLAFYGNSFTLSDPSNHDVYAPTSGAGQAGPYTRQPGFLAYYEICSYLINDQWTKVFQSEQKSNYAYKDNQWVGFDDVNSIKIKVDYITKMDIGGAMIWTLPLDDFAGKFCTNGSYPLAQTVAKLLVA